MRVSPSLTQLFSVCFLLVVFFLKGVISDYYDHPHCKGNLKGQCSLFLLYKITEVARNQIRPFPAGLKSSREFSGHRLITCVSTESGMKTRGEYEKDKMKIFIITANNCISRFL